MPRDRQPRGGSGIAKSPRSTPTDGRASRLEPVAFESHGSRCEADLHLLLAALVALNLVGFSIELASYRRRMWLLRERKPELARSYGLPPAVRREEG